MAHITAVRLKAFKSVAGGWQEFRFDPGLNAIVGALPRQGNARRGSALAVCALPDVLLSPILHAGPNGCGKSSLLDALCFAFAAPPRTFAAASLADLANSDSSEVRRGV